jgi:hypothetical protein
MGLQPREDLDIIELVYYVPEFLLAIWCIKKHGLRRQLGWVYLAILGLLRIIGAAAGIAAYSESTPFQDLVETSTIAFSIGISPLLLSLLGILTRLNGGAMKIQGGPRSRLATQAIHLPILIGLVLGVYGGTKEFASDPATVQDGYKFVKISVILYLVGWMALCLLTFYTVSRRHEIFDDEKRLLLVSVLSLPFLFVRILYSIIAAFDNTSSAFSIRSTSNTAVVVQAIMSILMEFIVVAMFLDAGLSVRVSPRDAAPTYTEQNRPKYQQVEQMHLNDYSRDENSAADA